MDAFQDLGLCAVTGGTGWFASTLVATLNSQSYHVIAIDINPPSLNSTSINPHLAIDSDLTTFIKCDIRNTQQLSHALKNVKTVFHVCTITDIRVCPATLMHDVNVNGTACLIACCVAEKVQNLIYTSSMCAAYDGKPKYQITEEFPYVFDNFNEYGKTKAKAEQLCLSAENSNNDLAVAVLRMGSLYGVGDPVLFTACDSPKVVIVGCMNSSISFISVENCALAHIATAKKLADEQTRYLCSGQIFNIKDVDYNYLKWYRDVLCETNDMKEIYMPKIVIYFIAVVYDFFMLLMFKLFGFRLGHPVLSFGVLAVKLITEEHTLDCSKFDKLIGCFPRLEVEEIIERTRAWKRKNYTKKRRTLLFI